MKNPLVYEIMHSSNRNRKLYVTIINVIQRNEFKDNQLDGLFRDLSETMAKYFRKGRESENNHRKNAK